MRRSFLALALSLPFLAAAAPAHAADDYSDTARNIIPSGQYPGIPANPDAANQAKMYDALTPLFDKVSSDDLLKDFKSAKLGASDSCPCRTEAVPRAGVTLTRDVNDVPHIKGETRDDVTWATGYVFAEDRALLIQVGRYPGRYAALDAPGVNAFSLVTGVVPTTVSAQADRIITEQNDASLESQGDEGRQLLHDIDVYIEGINARLRETNSTQKPFTRADVYSVNALAGQIFGQGGGGEVNNANLRAALVKRLGAEQGAKVFDQLSQHDDPDAPVTDPGSFPYEQLPANGDTSGNALLDLDSEDQGAAGEERVREKLAQRHTSNFLMVSGQKSTTGHPLLVGGPQIGYYYPGLTLEMDLEGPGYAARGAAIPGGPGNILIGRGEDDAWSLTSAGGDTNDVFVETLCGNGSTQYLFDGECRDMETIDAGTINGKDVSFKQTVHGPVSGYATVDGRRVALSFDRASRGHDIDWQLMFNRLTHGDVKDPQTFFDAAAKSAFTFNVSYMDDRDIATYTAGRLPLRADGVDPRLPTDGSGAHEWKGFLPPTEHPQALDPADGTLVNWNNKPAQGFGASDSQRDLGSVHRVELLKRALQAQIDAGGGKTDLAGVTSAMNKAATQDLRATGPLFGALADVLGAAPAPSARDARMLDLLKGWEASGSSRLDRDLDGKMDAGGAPAIMDAAWPRIRDAVLSPALGSDLARYDALVGNNSTGSGFTGGGISLVDKVLRQVDGTQFQQPLDLPLCGNGDKAACGQALWAAIDAAGDQIADAQGTDDPDAWTSDATKERIDFAPLPLTQIRYTNRPSGIQQVISFSGHRPRPDTGTTTTTTTPVTPPVGPVGPTQTVPVPVRVPTAQPRSPKVRLTFGAFRLSRTGRATVTLRCPTTKAKLRCAGTVTVTRSGKRVVRVSYSLASGASRKVSFRPTAAVRRIVARRGRSLLRVAVTNQVSGRTTRTTVRSARLKRAR